MVQSCGYLWWMLTRYLGSFNGKVELEKGFRDMVDAYKLLRDLSTVRLDELLCEFEFYEQANPVPKRRV